MKLPSLKTRKLHQRFYQNANDYCLKLLINFTCWSHYLEDLEPAVLLSELGT